MSVIQLLRRDVCPCRVILFHESCEIRKSERGREKIVYNLWFVNRTYIMSNGCPISRP